MKFSHLFEFMDQSWLPESLAATLREILSCGNAAPFRGYYGWVGEKVVKIAREKRCHQIVELGAGTAPITRQLIPMDEINGVRFVVCDARPERATYEALERTYPGRVEPIYDSVDFSVPRQWGEGTLLVLSATFHHIPEGQRHQVIQSLSESADVVVIAEPLRKSLLSIAFVFLSVFPAVLLPIWYFGRPGKLRRFFWCWLFPIAPVMFWWDGVVSCLRMWTEEEWAESLKQTIPDRSTGPIQTTLFSQLIAW